MYHNRNKNDVTSTKICVMYEKCEMSCFYGIVRSFRRQKIRKKKAHTHIYYYTLWNFSSTNSSEMFSQKMCVSCRLTLPAIPFCDCATTMMFNNLCAHTKNDVSFFKIWIYYDDARKIEWQWCYLKKMYKFPERDEMRARTDMIRRVSKSTLKWDSW